MQTCCTCQRPQFRGGASEWVGGPLTLMQPGEVRMPTQPSRTVWHTEVVLVVYSTYSSEVPAEGREFGFEG